MEVRRSAFAEDKEPKAFQADPSVEYCQMPLPVLAVTARPLSALMSTSTQFAPVRIAAALVAKDAVFSSVVGRV